MEKVRQRCGQNVGSRTAEEQNSVSEINVSTKCLYVQIGRHEEADSVAVI